MTDPNTGRSKGFGFVRFGDEGERDRALVEMNGVPCGSRVMRISLAIPRKAGVEGVAKVAAASESVPISDPAAQTPRRPSPRTAPSSSAGWTPR